MLVSHGPSQHRAATAHSSSWIAGSPRTPSSVGHRRRARGAVGLTGGRTGVRLPGRRRSVRLLAVQVDVVSGLRLTRAISRGLAFPVRPGVCPSRRPRRSRARLRPSASDDPHPYPHPHPHHLGRQRPPNRRTDRDLMLGGSPHRDASHVARSGCLVRWACRQCKRIGRREKKVWELPAGNRCTRWLDDGSRVSRRAPARFRERRCVRLPPPTQLLQARGLQSRPEAPWQFRAASGDQLVDGTAPLEVEGGRRSGRELRPPFRLCH